MIKTRSWIIGIAALLLLSAAAMLWTGGQTDGRIANIYVDGQCVRSIELDALTARETFTVPGRQGYNVVCAEPGRICVLEADCPDQICVRAGWLHDSAAPIVCLPHRLVIQLEDAPAAQIDAVSQ